MKKTTDIWFVAWLESLKSISFSEFNRIDHRRASYSYDLNDSQWDVLKLEFFKSDMRKVREAIERLKDLLH